MERRGLQRATLKSPTELNPYNDEPETASDLDFRFVTWDPALEEDWDQENYPLPGLEAAFDTSDLEAIRSASNVPEYKQARLPARLLSHQARSAAVHDVEDTPASELQHSTHWNRSSNTPRREQNELQPSGSDPGLQTPDGRAQPSRAGDTQGPQKIDMYSQMTHVQSTKQTSHLDDTIDVSDVCNSLNDSLQDKAPEQSRRRLQKKGSSRSMQHECCEDATRLSFQGDDVKSTSNLMLLDEAVRAEAELKEGWEQACESRPLGSEEHGFRLSSHEHQRSYKETAARSAIKEREAIGAAQLASHDRLVEGGESGALAAEENFLEVGAATVDASGGADPYYQSESSSEDELLRRPPVKQEVESLRVSSESESSPRVPKRSSKPTSDSLTAYQVAFFRAKGEYLAWQQLRDVCRSEVEKAWARKQLFEAKKRFHAVQTAVLNLRVSEQQATELELSLCMQIGVDVGLINLRSARKPQFTNGTDSRRVSTQATNTERDREETQAPKTAPPSVCDSGDSLSESRLLDLTSQMDNAFSVRRLLGPRE